MFANAHESIMPPIISEGLDCLNPAAQIGCADFLSEELVGLTVGVTKGRGVGLPTCWIRRRPKSRTASWINKRWRRRRNCWAISCHFSWLERRGFGKALAWRWRWWPRRRHCWVGNWHLSWLGRRRLSKALAWRWRWWSRRRHCRVGSWWLSWFGCRHQLKGATFRKTSSTNKIKCHRRHHRTYKNVDYHQNRVVNGFDFQNWPDHLNRPTFCGENKRLNFWLYNMRLATAWNWSF